MNKLVSLVAALVFLAPPTMVPQISSRLTTTISGRILDREGKPMANAVVVYSETTKGKIYQFKTDNKGEFSVLGVVSGYYKIEITAPDGTRVYTGTRPVGTNENFDPMTGLVSGDNKPLKTNVLNVDLSTVRPNGEMAGSSGAENVSESDLKAIRDENARGVRINELVPELRIALDARDWPRATRLLQRLMAIDPGRWEYYQNLGTIQNATSQYEAAVQTFAKAIELARKGLAKTPTREARATISGMLISQAEAYRRMEKLDEAIACYHQAAELTAQPALAHFYACSAYQNSGKLEAAMEECDQAIASDPQQWEPYQAKAAIESALGKDDAALATYDAGIQAARAAVASNVQPAKAREGMGQMLNAEANVYVQMQQAGKAIPLFAQSAEVSVYPALPYLNLCAVLYNRNDLIAAVSACDKAIASDPGLADAYFIKASALFAQGKLQQGRYQVPDGTGATLNKYLELSPDGRHAAEASAMLEKLSAKK